MKSLAHVEAASDRLTAPHQYRRPNIWRSALIGFVAFLLFLGPFLHAHSGAFRISGFHMPGLDGFKAASNASASLRQGEVSDLVKTACPIRVHGPEGMHAEWPDSTSRGVDPSLLRELLALEKSGQSSASLAKVSIELACWLVALLALLNALIRGSEACRIGPVFTRLFRPKPPAQAPPQG